MQMNGDANKIRYAIIALIFPVIRLFPPWWKARLYGRLAGAHFGAKEAAGIVRRRRVQPHHYEMDLLIDDPMERFAYFVGCYWGLDVTAVVMTLLRRGDFFIDVGANLGFLTLTAAKQVGREGKVLAFEPLIEMANRLIKHWRITQ